MVSTSSAPGQGNSSAGDAGAFVAIAASVAQLLSAVGIGSGCGQTCIVASNYANRAEAAMKQNLAAWQALGPNQKTKSIQTLAVQNYDQLWDGLVQACSNPQLGNAGKRCISDRDRNGKFPWAVWYRDPIAQTSVIDDGMTGALYSAVAVSSTSALTWLEQNWEVALLAGIVGVLALSGSRGSGR